MCAEILTTRPVKNDEKLGKIPSVELQITTDFSGHYLHLIKFNFVLVCLHCTRQYISCRAAFTFPLAPIQTSLVLSILYLVCSFVNDCLKLVIFERFNRSK